jgi:hypothetical protein
MLQPPNDGRPAVPGPGHRRASYSQPHGRGQLRSPATRQPPAPRLVRAEGRRRPNGAPVRHIPRSAGRGRRAVAWRFAPCTPAAMVARDAIVRRSLADGVGLGRASRCSASRQPAQRQPPLLPEHGRREEPRELGPRFALAVPPVALLVTANEAALLGVPTRRTGAVDWHGPAFSLPGSARTVASVREPTRRQGPLGSAPRSARALAWPCRPTSASTSAASPADAHGPPGRT